jgi:hypothetical protein
MQWAANVWRFLLALAARGARSFWYRFFMIIYRRRFDDLNVYFFLDEVWLA